MPVSYTTPCRDLSGIIRGLQHFKPDLDILGYAPKISVFPDPYYLDKNDAQKKADAEFGVLIDADSINEFTLIQKLAETYVDGIFSVSRPYQCYASMDQVEFETVSFHHIFKKFSEWSYQRVQSELGYRTFNSEAALVSGQRLYNLLFIENFQRQRKPSKTRKETSGILIRE